MFVRPEPPPRILCCLRFLLEALFPNLLIGISLLRLPPFGFPQWSRSPSPELRGKGKTGPWLAPSGGEREGSGDRPRDHELGGGGDGGREADDRDQCRGPADHAVGCRLHKERRPAGGADREAAGRGEPGEHVLLGEALHREKDGRGR